MIVLISPPPVTRRRETPDAVHMATDSPGVIKIQGTSIFDLTRRVKDIQYRQIGEV
jgi:hypothetical protein